VPQGTSAGDECHLIYEGALVLHNLDLEWDVELAIEALEKVNYNVDRLEQRFRDTLLDTFSEGKPDAEIAASVLEWDCDRADDALDALHAALTRESSGKSTAASANANATPPRTATTEPSQIRLSPYFKRTPTEGKKSDGAEKDTDSPNNESESTGDTPLVEPPERMKSPLLGKAITELGEELEESQLATDGQDHDMEG